MSKISLSVTFPLAFIRAEYIYSRSLICKSTGRCFLLSSDDVCKFPNNVRCVWWQRDVYRVIYGTRTIFPVTLHTLHFCILDVYKRIWRKKNKKGVEKTTIVILRYDSISRWWWSEWCAFPGYVRIKVEIFMRSAIERERERDGEKTIMNNNKKATSDDWSRCNPRRESIALCATRIKKNLCMKHKPIALPVPPIKHSLRPVYTCIYSCFFRRSLRAFVCVCVKVDRRCLWNARTAIGLENKKTMFAQ